MSVSDKILELRTHREAIRQAINDKGVELAEGSPMSDYAGAIDEISGGEVDYSIFKGYTILTPEMVLGTFGSSNQRYIGTATHLIIDDSFPNSSLHSLFRDNQTLKSLVILTNKFTNMNSLFYDIGSQFESLFINTSKVISMSNMLRGSQATTLDLSSFDTSNAINMSAMFRGSQATTLDLSSFDTSKVTNMSNMFQICAATKLDLSSFNTSNVTNMSYMFYSCKDTSLDLSSFNTSNVTNMSYMFGYSQATSLDLLSFNTSNVTSMSNMFYYSQATSLDLSSFDTTNVTSMSNMFYSSQATSLDLSSFDTTNVANMTNMFQNSKATIGYARTQADADRFNASSNKPASLNFIVKP